MHSHHSHSGDYISHATDTLEQITDEAIAQNFAIFCLTEHMPRLHSKYLYPEETELSPSSLAKQFENYVKHARSIQGSKISGTKFLVGMEVEGIDEEHIQLAQSLFTSYQLDMMVGSIHHVKGIPIDFDQTTWNEALTACGGRHQLYLSYFSSQRKVLSLKPHVVGHFDLIRLFDNDKVIPWGDVWAEIEENIKIVVGYGGMFEINGAAFRKGWDSAYPMKDVCDVIIKHGGTFCLSDDSHSVKQVGLNYDKVLDYIVSLNLESICYLDKDGSRTVVKMMSMDDVKKSVFWNKYNS